MSQQPVDRREFAKRLAAGAAGVTLAAPVVPTEAAPPGEEFAQRQGPGNGDGNGFGPPPAHVLLVEYVHQKYPHPELTVDLLERIEGDVRSQISRGDRLARHPFTNADEPATVFAAYRADG